MGGISNLFITSILNPTCPNFQGVYSADTVPKTLTRHDTFSIVCNLSKVEETGSHFITIISVPSYVLYIDSFGVSCSVVELQNFLVSLRKPIFFNSTKIQHASSSFCGFFCILFVLKFNHPSTIIRFENVNLRKNDNICVKKIQDILNKCIY